MPDLNLLHTIIDACDALIAVMAATFWLALVRGRREGAGAFAIAVVLLAALAWGALWAWHPTFAAMRLAPPPQGQVTAILTLVLGLPALLIFANVRKLILSLDPITVTALGPWRIVFGSILLLLGLLGGLPQGFFVSAAIGDILTGIWAISILSRRTSVTVGEYTLWNLFGLADLLHVLALAVIHLRPFLLSHPELPPLNLLPLVGVPLFIVLHTMTLWAIATRRIFCLTPTASNQP